MLPILLCKTFWRSTHKTHTEQFQIKRELERLRRKKNRLTRLISSKLLSCVRAYASQVFLYHSNVDDAKKQQQERKNKNKTTFQIKFQIYPALSPVTKHHKSWTFLKWWQHKNICETKFESTDTDKTWWFYDDHKFLAFMCCALCGRWEKKKPLIFTIEVILDHIITSSVYIERHHII